MKIIIVSLIALCAHLSLQAGVRPAASRNFGEISIHQVAAKVQANGNMVTPGTSRIMVSMRLGSPNVVLADGSWLYHGYSAQLTPSGPNPRGTLVVRFTDSKVTSLALADNATVTALRQTPRPTAADQLLAVR